MKAEEFVLKLEDNAPTVNEYLSVGYSEKLAKEVSESFYCPRKKNNSVYIDELLRLIDSYNIKNFEAASVIFNENIIEEPDFYLVGEVEADWLIVDKITGIVRVVELYSTQPLWPCAANGNKFLDALLEIKLFIKKTSLDKNWIEDQNILCAISEQCGNIAGGEQYIEFYKMLIGCFE
jgi:hypothetical protein